MSDLGNTVPQGQEGTGDQGDPYEGLNDFGRSYVERIPDESERRVFAKHVKDWDGEVTRRFQTLAEQTRAYQGIDPNRARAAEELVNRLRLNPGGALEDLARGGHLKAEHLAGVRALLEEAEAAPSGEGNVDFEKLLDQRLQPLMGALNKIGPQFEELQKAETTRQQEAQYNKLHKELETKYGDKLMPEQWLLSHMSTGIDPEAAQKMWESTLAEKVKGYIPPRAPYSAGGAGQAPNLNKPVQEMTEDQTTDYVAERLRQLMGE